MATTEAQAKTELKEMYDDLAASYDRFYQSAAGQYFMGRKIATLLKLAPFAHGSHLLEIGCANGIYSVALAQRGFQVTGLDLSPQCVSAATAKAKQANLPNCRFITGDAEALSQVANNTFDGAFSFSALRYLARPDLAIREIYRVLRPGGLAVVDFPNKLSPWFTLLKPRLTGETHIHDHQYTTGYVRSLLRNAGFQQIAVRRILYTPKTIPDGLLPVMKVVDFIGELPGLNQFASIIIAGGVK